MNNQDSSDEARDPSTTPGASSVASPGEMTGELPKNRDQLVAAQREIQDLLEALAASRFRERALTHELQHRVRNMLAVIRSIYRRSWESGASQKQFAEHFSGRLDAVARYQSQLEDVSSIGIEIEDILRNELLEGHCLDGPRCSISGPPVHLRQKSAELVGLAIHELTTNSIKFGALGQDGTLAVEWSVEGSLEGPLLRFRWTEAGVSVAGSAPRPSGFGRQLIEEALPYQLGATTSFELRPGGLDCSILLPLPNGEFGVEDHHQSAADELPILTSEPE